MHCASSLRTDPTLTLTPGWQIEWTLDKTGNEYLLRRPLHRRVQSEHILWHRYLILCLMDISMESFTFCRLQHPWVLIIDFLNWMAQNSFEIQILALYLIIYFKNVTLTKASMTSPHQTLQFHFPSQEMINRVQIAELLCLRRSFRDRWVESSAANRLIGEVVQSRRRPLLGTGRLVNIVSYSCPYLMIIASRTQFYVYLRWGQRPFSIVS